MLIINRLKNPKQYEPEQMPKFQHRLSRIAWLKRQRRKLALSDIKSVSIQIRDIEQMICSKNSLLVALYTRLYKKLHLDYVCDTDNYVNIRKCKKNEPLIFALINEDWILKPQEFEGKTFRELKDLQDQIQQQIDIQLIKRDPQVTDERLKLLRYKVDCLWRLICQMDRQSVFNGVGVKYIVKKI